MAFKDTFRGDSAYSQIMTKVFDVLWLSVLSILCCIPVITIGASLSSLYYVMLKLVRDEETAVTRNYFKAFKQNFLQSLPATLILLAIIGILTADFHILGQNIWMLRGDTSGRGSSFFLCISTYGTLSEYTS